MLARLLPFIGAVLGVVLRAATGCVGFCELKRMLVWQEATIEATINAMRKYVKQCTYSECHRDIHQRIIRCVMYKCMADDATKVRQSMRTTIAVGISMIQR